MLMICENTVHFDPIKILALSTDASTVGIRAMELHRLDDGSEVPIAHDSITLSTTQRNFLQIENEVLFILVE